MVPGYLARLGPGAIIGLFVGWAAFDAFAQPDCGPGSDVLSGAFSGVLRHMPSCPKLLFGITHDKVLTGFAVVGGVIGIALKK
jgi:hypothetical protein